ncbi:MAG: type II toxin-antitoxin system Phd/YefM family antitoxin [Chloroflexota bacterium]
MRQAVKRIPATQVKVHLGQIVQEVEATSIPVIIQNRGEDRAVIISLSAFQSLWPTDETARKSARGRVRAALHTAGLLSEPTTQETAEVQAFETQHPPEDQERILAEWRELEISPPLSEIVLRNREQGV